IRSSSSDDHRILTKPEGIKLIYPQEIGGLGAPGFLSSARKFWSRQVPVREFSCFWIKASQVAAFGGDPHVPVRAEVNAVRETSRKRQRIIFEFPRLWIETP